MHYWQNLGSIGMPPRDMHNIIRTNISQKRRHQQRQHLHHYVWMTLISSCLQFRRTIHTMLAYSRHSSYLQYIWGLWYTVQQVRVMGEDAIKFPLFDKVLNVIVISHQVLEEYHVDVPLGRHRSPPDVVVLCRQIGWSRHQHRSNHFPLIGSSHTCNYSLIEFLRTTNINYFALDVYLLQPFWVLWL